MKKFAKNIIRQILIKLQLPVTKNIRYDILTEKILKQELKSDSNCIDVGAHKGEILSSLLKYSPKGRHIAFEPIPYLYAGLKNKYSNNVDIYPYALSDHAGTTEFNLVLDDPAYSGLKQRKYKTETPSIETIQVEVKTLDQLLPLNSRKIHLIKIDVEGGEFDVLKGAQELLKRDKPILIFECGKGASEYYGAGPLELIEYLKSVGYNLYTLDSYYHKKSELESSQFKLIFESGSDYYFVASTKLANLP